VKPLKRFKIKLTYYELVDILSTNKKKVFLRVSTRKPEPEAPTSGSFIMYVRLRLFFLRHVRYLEKSCFWINLQCINAR